MVGSDKRTIPTKDGKPEDDPEFMRVVDHFLKTPPKPHKEEKGKGNAKRTSKD